MEPIQCNFFVTNHSSMSASHSAAGKQRRQEENGAAVKIARKGKTVNENKSSSGRMRIKTPSIRCGRHSGQHNLLCCRYKYSVQIHFVLLFISLLDLLFKLCCVNSVVAVVGCSVDDPSSQLFLRMSKQKCWFFYWPTIFVPFLVLNWTIHSVDYNKNSFVCSDTGERWSRRLQTRVFQVKIDSEIFFKLICILISTTTLKACGPTLWMLFISWLLIDLAELKTHFILCTRNMHEQRVLLSVSIV